jgi:hypothetical protein
MSSGTRAARIDEPRVAAVLARLGASARRLVTLELGLGTIARHAPDVCRPHVLPLESWGAGALELAELDRVLDRLIAKTERYDAAAIDSVAAVAVHRNLPMPRRIAADPGVWRWLAVVHRPDFVRHRWELRAWATMRDRFWKAGTRPDSNVFARLWWIAELSRTGDDYTATERLLRSQSLANAVFVRRLSDHAPFVHACARVLVDQPSYVIERVLARFNMMASTMPVEGRGVEQIADGLERLVEEVGVGWST